MHLYWAASAAVLARPVVNVAHVLAIAVLDLSDKIIRFNTHLAHV